MTADTTLVPGDAVEFWSGEGRWKPGVVAEVIRASPYIRMCVGEGVHVTRKRSRVRTAEQGGHEDEMAQDATPHLRAKSARS